MNKKSFKKIKTRELIALLEQQEVTRLEFAAALGVSESTLRRWLRDSHVPEEVMDQINTQAFKDSLKHSGWKRTEWRKTFESNDSTKDSESNSTIDLSRINLDRLVDEIESRGWKVQISRKADENK